MVLSSKIFSNAIILLFVLIPISSSIQSYANANDNDNKEVFTLQDKIMLLNKNIVETERSLKDISEQMDNIKENITVFLTKETKKHLINFLKLTLDNDLLYKKEFDIKENEILEDNPVGIPVKRIFFVSKKEDRILKIKCLYSKRESTKKDSKMLSQEITLSYNTKISTYISISLVEQSEPQNQKEDDIEMIIKFW